MFKRILSTIIPMSLMATMTITVAAADHSQIVILHSNDTHCQLEAGVGIAGFAGYADEMKALYGEDYVTLVDAGDFIQGAPVGGLSQGQFIIDAYNAAKYDIVTLGNHEFDYQIPRMFALMDQLEATVVSSNFIEVATGESVYDPYKILSYGDVDVAYIGIATPESYTKSTPAYFMDDAGNLVYSFSEGNNAQDMYDNIQHSIDSAIAEGADYVVGLAHLGIEETSAPWRSIDVIENTSGFDVFIDGHSHNFMVGEMITDAAGNDVPLTQMGEYYDYIGKIVIDPVADTITCYAIPPEEVTTQNADVLAALERINAELDPLLDEIVAYADVPLAVTHPETGERLIRNNETNLGNLVADAYRTMLDTDIALVNAGGIRADIPAGDISFREVIEVHPFGNNGTSIYATGQHILDALEMGAKNAPNESGGFLHTSGLTYTIDTTIPSSIVTDDMGSFVSVDGTYRVKDVMIGNEPLDLNRTYSVASHDYMLLSGGDGMSMFQDCTPIKTLFMIDNEILINYIDKHLNGVVGEAYANLYGQNRINIITAEDLPITPPVTPSIEPSVEPLTTLYLVVEGDSLWKIASQELGNGTRWEEIPALNPTIKNPNLIWVGQTLALPAK